MWRLMVPLIKRALNRPVPKPHIFHKQVARDLKQLRAALAMPRSQRSPVQKRLLLRYSGVHRYPHHYGNAEVLLAGGAPKTVLARVAARWCEKQRARAAANPQQRATNLAIMPKMPRALSAANAGPIAMTFHEAMLTMGQQPRYIAVSDSGRVFRLNRSGKLMDASSPYRRYARIRAQDVLGATWNCWTPEQIQQRAEMDREVCSTLVNAAGARSRERGRFARVYNRNTYLGTIFMTAEN
jgi:hypothetical protein